MSSSGAAGAQPRVAVLGAGTMGRGMAHSLLRSGFTVDVWDRTPERAAAAGGGRGDRPRGSRGTRSAKQTWSSPWSRTRTR